LSYVSTNIALYARFYFVKTPGGVMDYPARLSAGIYQPLFEIAIQAMVCRGPIPQLAILFTFLLSAVCYYSNSQNSITHRIKQGSGSLCASQNNDC